MSSAPDGRDLEKESEAQPITDPPPDVDSSCWPAASEGRVAEEREPLGRESAWAPCLDGKIS